MYLMNNCLNVSWIRNICHITNTMSKLLHYLCASRLHCAVHIVYETIVAGREYLLPNKSADQTQLPLRKYHSADNRRLYTLEKQNNDANCTAHFVQLCML